MEYFLLFVVSVLSGVFQCLLTSLQKTMPVAAVKLWRSLARGDQSSKVQANMLVACSWHVRAGKRKAKKFKQLLEEKMIENIS